jgi:lysophospholipase L1-like esterase
VLRALARLEDVAVLVVAYPPERGSAAVTAKNAAELRARFLEDVGREAAVHHYPLVDSLAAYRDAPNADELFTPDGFHSTLAGHRVLGVTVAAGILASAASGAPAASLVPEKARTRRGD